MAKKVKIKESLGDKAKRQYQALTPVYSPLLKGTIYFNSDGYYHMVFKSNRERRKAKARDTRFTLIPLIIPTILNAKSIDEVRMTEREMRGQKIISCFALVANVGDKKRCKVKVVVRKLQGGEYFFHSVMRLKE